MVLMLIAVHVEPITLHFITIDQHLSLQCPDFDFLQFMRMQLHALGFLI